MAQKKTPMRMCIGCREMKPKNQLLRIVKTPEGEILLDKTGRKNGRGAYICSDENCLKKIRKIKALSHTFGMQVEESVYDELEKEFGKDE